MERLTFIAVMLLSAAVALSADLPREDVQKVWNFDKDPPGRLPEDFLVGTLFDGRPAGDWRVIQATAAPSPPNILAQLQGKGAEHAYKVVLVKDTDAAELELEVSFFATGGKGDMGGGLIWRAADDRNYYLTRANPLEQNIRIYRVVKGVRHMIENFDQPIEVNKWHSFRVVTRGCKVQVFYDNRPVFDLCDKTFTKGRIGLWTKSDAITYFDNLRFQPLN